jgi:fucose 4-O-acetylase-like acetyltransferase
VLASAIGLAYWWERRPSNRGWSPVRQLGRTSLLIYWIHVEMIYGLISLPIHRALTLTQVGVALALFTAFMLVCSLAKDRIAGWWGRRRLAVRTAGSTG